MGILILLTWGAESDAREIRIFAAASTVQVVQDLTQHWEETGGKQVRAVLGSSGSLARQVSLGAPADLYFSAAKGWVDYLLDKKIAQPGTRQTLATNRLVLISSPDARTPNAFNPNRDIIRLLGPTGRIALGDPGHVPAGQYARQALKKLQLWKVLRRRAVRTQNVRLALALVEQSETPLGIVYRSDVFHRKRVSILYTLPETLHSPIEYQIVAIRNAIGGASEFLSFLSSESGGEIFRKNGFSPVGN
ncbi:MAG: molybdate ABC transporter substrate-binding protein [Pseudomonadota bacterium]|nr:molybdate ABC transporter substrate-binding protein [Pseudomonadota bacterium]